MYGLIDRDLYYIRKALRKFPEIDLAVVFGSRAMGNYKQGSDVDLAIVGDQVSHKTMIKLSEWLNDVYPLPYMFDLLHYGSTSNENLKQHIDTFGKTLYRKEYKDVSTVEQKNETMSHTVYKADIVRGIQRLGVSSGDTLLVHSSLSSFGHVDGGALTVIQALQETVGPEGNLIVPTLSFKSVKDVNPFFSIADTPSDTGKVTEMFRKLPEARRSRHPMSSAAAMGPDVATVVGGKQTTPCGEDSPYYFVYAQGGYVLFLGAQFGSNTMFHVAEEIADPDYMRYKKLENSRIQMPDGRIETDTFYRYNCTQTGIMRKHDRLETVYREKGLVRDTYIGKAHCMLIPARDNVDVACDVLRQKPEYILA